jgi:hypothetical protein
MTQTFRHDGNTIFADPVRTKRPDGTTSVSLGFAVAEICDGVELGAAEMIARVMNSHEEMLTALDSLVRYAEWQIRDAVEYHPTLPSAVAAARAALAKARGEVAR